MKKLKIFLCALTVAAGAAFSPVFATVDGDKNDHAALKTADDLGMSQNVNAKSVSNNVYDVDIAWGNMEFAYNGTWNPDDHEYAGVTPEGKINATTGEAQGWYVESEDNNQVTVINHSNRQITDVITYTSNPGVVNNVTGTVVQNDASGWSAPINTLNNTAELNSADVTGIYGLRNAASAATATLTLAGAPDNDAFKTNAGAVIGTLTVTLTDTTPLSQT